MQSAATLAVNRQLSEHSTGTLTYSYSPAQGGLGLEVGVQRQLSNHSKGHLTWNVGPVGGVSTGMSRSKGLNSWKFDLSVGLAATGLTGFIARRLSKKSTFRFGFRCGTTAVDVDMGCTRRVSRESTVGLSVTIGLRGIHIKFRFIHSGQRFQFPVLISPTLTPVRVLCSLTLPALVVAAMKKYVVKPAALRRLKAKQEALREKFAESVKSDKKEAADTVTLLESQTLKRVEQERAKGGLVIEAAVFGNFPRRNKPKAAGEPIVPGFGGGKGGEGGGGCGGSPAAAEGGEGGAARGGGEGKGGGGGGGAGEESEANKKPPPPSYVPWIDVTTATRFMVFDSHLDLHEGLHKAGMLGFCDPCPGEDKYFRVRYRYRAGYTRSPWERTMG